VGASGREGREWGEKHWRGRKSLYLQLCSKVYEEKGGGYQKEDGNGALGYLPAVKRGGEGGSKGSKIIHMRIFS